MRRKVHEMTVRFTIAALTTRASYVDADRHIRSALNILEG